MSVIPLRPRPAPDDRPEFSVGGTLDVVAPFVPPALVPGEAWREVRAAAAWLPAALTPAAYLECRLGGEGGAVDLILRVEERGREVLAGRDPAVRLPRLLAEHPVWARVGGLCARWADDEASGVGPLAAVGHLWLEFDLGGEGGPDLPVPSLFVAPRPEAAATLSTGEWMALLDACAAALLPDGLPPGTRERLRGVVEARPDGASVPYLGFMLARPRAAVRVYFSGVAEADLPAALERAGWPGAGAGLAETLAGLAPADVRPAVGMAHLDVEDGRVLPRLGIEYTFDRRAQLRGELAEAPFVGALAERGLCTPARRDALLAWPGWETRRLPHEIWESRVVRRVNCVKLVLDQGRPPEAKGYLLTTCRPALRSRS